MADKKNKVSFGIDGATLAKIDWERARGRIVHDTKSDFIYAPHIGHIFTNGFEKLSELVQSELKAGNFTAMQPITIRVPKSSRMRVVGSRRLGPAYSRPGSILLPKDRLLYQVLADEAAPLINGHMDKSVCFSHWLADKSASDMFVPTRECWGALQKRLRRLSKDDELKYVVRLDVANYFSSINQHTLVNYLKAIGLKAELASPLENMLVRFTGDRSSRGIVQGVYPSDLLGTFYMCPLDISLKDSGCQSARYVDDVYIFCRSMDEAGAVVGNVIRELQNYDLTLNEQKSAILRKHLLATEEPDLEALFAKAVEEVHDNLADVGGGYGFQSNWDVEEEAAPHAEDLKLIATQDLFNAVAEFDGQEEKIERFCLPIFAAVSSDYACQHVMENFFDRPAMTQIYAWYLSKFIEEEEVRTFLCEALVDQRLTYGWQRMWVVAALLSDKVGLLYDYDSEVKACLSMMKQEHDAVKAVFGIFACRWGGFPRRKAIFNDYGNYSEYVRAALLFGAQFFPVQEKDNALKAWGGHSQLHELIAMSTFKQKA